jgi:hypothetical protein
MATTLKLRRGTTAQHTTFTGTEGEVTVDTDKDTVVVHDGTTAGGFPLARETGSTIKVAAGTVSAPGLTTTGDTNTGIFFPAADTIAFTEGGVEAMRITSAGNVGIGTTAPAAPLHIVSGTNYNTLILSRTNSSNTAQRAAINYRNYANNNSIGLIAGADLNGSTADILIGLEAEGAGSGGIGANNIVFFTAPTYGGTSGERMRIDSTGNVGINNTSPDTKLDIDGALFLRPTTQGFPTENGFGINLTSAGEAQLFALQRTPSVVYYNLNYYGLNHIFYGNGTERARITNGGDLLVGKTSTSGGIVGCELRANGLGVFARSAAECLYVSRLTNDGTLVQFAQADIVEGTISVSGNTVSYNAFCGGHWTQLQEGRGYNPDIPRGTVMSSIGEMAVWKSVEWTETIEHPAIEAVEAAEAVLDEDGNVIEPAIEAVEGKEAWTETFNKREAYLGSLDIGETFEEDGFTKTVVDDGNERLPKVKISDVVGDKAVYGVFQTWDEVEDMLVSSLGAFVVRIAAGVTVEVGDLLESNGDGCAKVQDDDIIRSKTIGKVTSTVATDTYDDGSYIVPCVLYCG